jgi:hypothetical protein
MVRGRIGIAVVVKQMFLQFFQGNRPFERKGKPDHLQRMFDLENELPIKADGSPDEIPFRRNFPTIELIFSSISVYP